MAKAKVTYEINAKDKSGQAVNAAQKRLEKFAKQGPKLVAAAAVGATAGLAALTKSAAASADQIGKLSLQLGVSERGLSQLKFIAAQTGVEFNTFTMAMQRSTRRVAEAAIGTGEAKDALRELGLNAQSLNELAPEDQFAARTDSIPPMPALTGDCSDPINPNPKREYGEYSAFCASAGNAASNKSPKNALLFLPIIALVFMSKDGGMGEWVRLFNFLKNFVVPFQSKI